MFIYKIFKSTHSTSGIISSQPSKLLFVSEVRTSNSSFAVDIAKKEWGKTLKKGEQFFAFQDRKFAGYS